MFLPFGQKLSKKGHIIFFVGVLTALVVTACLISFDPTFHRGVAFLIFAAIWLTGFFIAKRFPKDNK